MSSSDKKIDLNEYGNKYAKFKHHGWAGLGFLSVLLAINYFFSIPEIILLPLINVLIIYIVISLVMTYKYREGLAKHTIEMYNKNKYKIEKKKAKNALKLEKKKSKS